MCCCRRNRGGAKVGLAVAGEDINISYTDLQNLLKEFKDQMEVLKAKLKEDEIKVDHDPEVPVLDEEETLIKELNELREFVNNNKECIEEYFHIERTSALKNVEEDESSMSEEETNG